MEKKTKRFNIIDITAIVLVLVFAVGVVIRLNVGDNNKRRPVDIIYTVKVKNVRHFTVDALKKSNILTEEYEGKVIGEILSVDAEPYYNEINVNSGELAVVEVPDRYECTVVIKAHAKEKDGRYVVEDSKGVEYAGVDYSKDFAIVTKYVKTTGAIISIEEVDAENK